MIFRISRQKNRIKNKGARNKIQISEGGPETEKVENRWSRTSRSEIFLKPFFWCILHARSPRNMQDNRPPEVVDFRQWYSERNISQISKFYETKKLSWLDLIRPKRVTKRHSGSVFHAIPSNNNHWETDKNRSKSAKLTLQEVYNCHIEPAQNSMCLSNKWVRRSKIFKHSFLTIQLRKIQKMH